ncbi:MAG: hypothetical protein C0459_11180 [Chitinophaga sp.]|nr:hypothetical protein [Chitinophaga sp.]
MEKLEERFALAEISKEIFIKVSSKHKNQLTELEQKSINIKKGSSNLSLAIEKGITIASNLQQLWVTADFVHE